MGNFFSTSSILNIYLILRNLLNNKELTTTDKNVSENKESILTSNNLDQYEKEKEKENKELTLTSNNLDQYDNIPENIEILTLESESKDRRFYILMNNLNNQCMKEMYIKLKYYDHPITRLGNKTHKLEIHSEEFNKDLDLLPESLEKLIICSNSFNKCLNDLPSSLKHLELTSYDFNQNLQLLPIKLEYLDLNICSFNKILNIKNLDYLKIFKIKCDNIDNSINNLALNIEELHINANLNIELTFLPLKIRKLIFNSRIYNQNLNNLPSTLDHLELELENFNQDLLNLPHNITYMQLHIQKFAKTLNIQQLNKLNTFKIFCENFDNSIDNLPQNISDMIINCNCLDKEPDFILFDKLKTLEIISPNLKSVDKLSPSLNKLLIISPEFNVPINNLPTSLELLNICSEKFNQTLDNLPPNVKEIVILSNDFKQDVNNIVDSITKMTFLSNSIGINCKIRDNLDYILFIEPESLMLCNETYYMSLFIDYNNNNNRIKFINNRFIFNLDYLNKNKKLFAFDINKSSINYINKTESFYCGIKHLDKHESKNKENIKNYYYDLCYFNDTNKINFNCLQLYTKYNGIQTYSYNEL